MEEDLGEKIKNRLKRQMKKEKAAEKAAEKDSGTEDEWCARPKKTMATVRVPSPSKFPEPA